MSITEYTLLNRLREENSLLKKANAELEGFANKTMYLANLAKDMLVKGDCQPSLGIMVDSIEKIIINGPATIIIFTDGTKLVSKCCEGDTYDCEKGIYITLLKAFLSSEENFAKIMKKIDSKMVED